MKANVSFVMLILAWLSAGTAFAQLQSFDLSSYKNPYYKRSLLDLNFNLGGSNNWDFINSSSSHLNDTRSNFGAGFGGTFNQILNSPTEQRNWRFSLNENSSTSKNKFRYWDDTIGNAQNFNNNFNLGLITTNRFYKSNQIFFEIGTNVYLSNSYNNSKTKYYNLTEDTFFRSDKNKQSLSNINGAFRIAIGKGRIEQIEDARLAVYILEDLEKHNRLSHSPTNDEILEFAKVITQIRNKRFFDARLHKIEEITAVDSFLTANNLAKTHDVAYFTTVNDNWDNASLPFRSAGFRYSVGVTPAMRWYMTKLTGLPDDKSHMLGAGGDLQFDYNKPLNLYWQLDGNLTLKYLFSTTKLNNAPYNNTNINQLSADFSEKLGYYPNSRSSYNLTLGLVYYKTFYKHTESQEKGNSQTIYPQLMLNAYYYISQRIRLQANYTLRYSNDKNDYTYLGYAETSSNYINQNLTVALTYSIF